MLVLDFRSSSRQAFMRGFAKGLTAPFSLFGAFDGAPKLEIKEIKPPAYSINDALANDWRAVGNDLMTVIKQYEARSRTRRNP